MKHSVEVVVVIPVGPDSAADFVADTIESFIFYTKSTYKIIIADDSHRQIGEELRNIYAEVDVLYTPRPMGGMSGLYINLSHTYKYALQHYDFDLIFKLDTDALIINAAPEKEALQMFKNDASIGIAGQYPNEYDGKPWDKGWPRARILNGTLNWKRFRRPFSNIYLKRLFIKAIDNGYKPGESVFGGAYFIGKLLLEKLNNDGLLPFKKLRGLNMGEDHLFALLSKSAGFHFGNLATGNLPFACAWKGLPAAPEQLYFEHKKVIHSVRYWNNMDEAAIRKYYSKKRVEEASNKKAFAIKEMNLKAV